jgi:LmbE family N-acetylglucosaminyl deacetylase
MKRILVLSPHPDDEAIGCGGTLRWHVEQGDDVRVIFLTSGELGVRGKDPADTARIRESEAAAAVKVLGCHTLEFWRQRDGHCKVTPALVQRLDVLLETTKPDILYVPHGREAHRDHRAALRLVVRVMATRVAPPSVLLYEVWTPLQQIDHVQDISAHIEVKCAAIRAHRSQCDIMQFDDAARGLARYRGEMHSWPGGPYAEVFQRLSPRKIRRAAGIHGPAQVE